MTDTIPNVPRELLENLIEQHITAHGCTTETARQAQLMLSAPSPANHVEDARTMVAAPSPAGVDGCKCSMSISMLGDGCRHCQPQEYIDQLGEMLDEERAGLSDAQAIIDGLRGENQRIQQELRLHQSQIESSGRIADRAQRFAVQLRTERDQQAQRIGELEGLLNRVKVSLSLDDTEWGYSAPEKYKLLADIRAALSAGKENQDEHN